MTLFRAGALSNRKRQTYTRTKARARTSKRITSAPARLSDFVQDAPRWALTTEGQKVYSVRTALPTLSQIIMKFKTALKLP